MSLTFFIFHSDISGSCFKFEQLQNKYFILVNSLVFHLDISGIDTNDEQL